jgi:hypothetical protein
LGYLKTDDPIVISKEELYEKSPNGGIFYTTLRENGFFEHDCEQDKFELSRKIFLMPKSNLDFEISHNKDSYTPKENVGIQIKMATDAEEDE